MKAQLASFVCLLTIISTSHAQDLSIVDVRRNITLADEDPIYKDFYINGGESDGLKKNLVVTAFRRIQVRDSNGTQSFGEISIPVGQLRVLATYGKISVAREYKLLSRDEFPMLEQIGLMSGDQIELKGAFVDDKKMTAKRKTAAVPPPAPIKQNEIVVTTSVTTTSPAPSQPAPTTAQQPASPVNSAKTADAGASKAQ